MIDLKKVYPPTNVLRQLLEYDPYTGKLFWRKRDRKLFSSDRDWKKWNTRYAEQEAFTSADRYGYLIGSIFSHVYRAHRIIWMMHFGGIENGLEIDHINGARDDNRISNLRTATVSQNRSNARMPSNNTSGVKGVAWYARTKKWKAQTKVNGKRKHLGYFSTIAEAEAAYLFAVEKHKGQFAYHNRPEE